VPSRRLELATEQGAQRKASGAGDGGRYARAEGRGAGEVKGGNRGGAASDTSKGWTRTGEGLRDGEWMT